MLKLTEKRGHGGRQTRVGNFSSVSIESGDGRKPLKILRNRYRSSVTNS